MAFFLRKKGCQIWRYTLSWYINGNCIPIRHEDETNVVLDWDYGCESPELFEQWKKDSKMDPIYLDESYPVKYELNSLGYRCKNFSEYEGKSFILVIGCSHTYGTGLHNEHIWCNQLGANLNMPVMNLASAGMGPDWLYTITSTYAHNNKYPKPFLVVLQWPGRFRRLFAREGTLQPHHPTTEFDNFSNETVEGLDFSWYLKRYIIEDEERIRYNHYNFLATKKLWESWGVPVVNFTYEDDYIEGEIFYPSIHNIKTDHTGYARDLQHDGRGIHKQVADKLEKILANV